MKHILSISVLLTGTLLLASLAPNFGSEPAPPSGAEVVRAMSESFHATSQQVIPSVVKVMISRGSNGKSEAGKLDLFGDFFSDFAGEKNRDLRSIGSGVLVSPSGIVLTNHHVVEDEGTITVELYDGRRFGVTSVKRDPSSDLAVLTLDSDQELPYLEFADSDTLEIGDWVLAIGTPFMLESSVSAGIISAKNRFLHDKEGGNYIQTDAAINPGNSGGPLVDLSGRIVGINTAIATVSGGYQGVGFAIPSNTARWIMKQLIENGKVERAFLGAPSSELSYEEAKSLGLPPRFGVKTDTPYKNSPAAKAGIRNGDIILEFDGKTIDSPETFRAMVECADIDVVHSLTVLRKGESGRLTLSIKLEIRPENYVGVPQTENLVEKGKHHADKTLGLMLIPMTDSAAERLGAAPGSGVVILSVTPGGRAYRAGLRDGMVLLKLNGTPTPTLDAYRGAAETVSPDAPCEFEVIVKKEIRTLTAPAAK
ncbi:MAG: trypsin-like peptidase domain-containing protein [Thermoguttaceae bacterium]|nr:trypsin-like peptidase domain-containing protein [Thermoguttaceae bacterium]